jgi:hypothetical protein
MGAAVTVIPFPRQRPMEAPQQPDEIPATAARPQPKAALPGQRKPSRWPLPCGRNSAWKKPINGNAVKRPRKSGKHNDD